MYKGRKAKTHKFAVCVELKEADGGRETVLKDKRRLDCMKEMKILIFINLF